MTDVSRSGVKQPYKCKVIEKEDEGLPITEVYVNCNDEKEKGVEGVGEGMLGADEVSGGTGPTLDQSITFVPALRFIFQELF